MNLRKVALVVASLDRDAADRLLDHFPDVQARAIRDAMMALTDASDQETREAIEQFIGVGTTVDELGGSTPRGVASADILGRMATSSEAENDRDIAAIERASERMIADCLRDELPQAIAVALAQLPTRRASEVVSFLPAEQQAEVLERMVALGPASGLEQAEVRDAFHTWLSEQIDRALHRSELATRLAAILEATPAGTRQRILQNVSHSDAELAKELQHQLVRGS